ncbi:MAG: NADH-quinone oxidoreductase subunit N [bacterium]|nr:NADH-quinone oxidoreductase subunit N [bacterium]
MLIPAPPISDLLALLPEMMITVTACALLVADVVTRRQYKQWLGWGAIGAIVLTLLMMLLMPPSAGAIFAGMFVADGYANFFKVLFLIAAILTILVSLRYLDDENAHYGEYYALLLFATLGMMFMAGGGDLITIYLGLELMSISTYVLAGFIRHDVTSIEAAVKYFLMGAFTSGIMLYGLALIYGLTGSTNLAAVAQGLGGLSLDNPALALAMILLVAGFGFKVAAVPFHMWVPDAYEGAPTSITAFMSSAVKAAAFAGLARVFLVAFFPAAEQWEVLWWVLAAMSMILGNVVALAQTSLKRMLAYSSISHAGYALIGVVAATQAKDLGLSSMLFYMFVYMFTTLGAFSMIILLTHRGFRGDHISDFTGLARSHPLAALLYTVFFLSLAGIPPTAGFVGKLIVFRAAIESGFIILAIIGVATSAIAAYYYFMVIKTMFMEQPVGEAVLSPARPLTVGLAIMGVATLLLGLFPNILLKFAQASVQTLL